MRQLNVAMERRPVIGIDAADPAQVRAWLLERASDLVVLDAALAPGLAFVGPGWIEEVSLARAGELGQESLLAAVFRTLAERVEVQSAFRLGETLLPGDGRLRRAACVLELGPDDSWWLATRWFGSGDAGVGVWHGAWEQREGSGVDELPEPLREWIDATGAEIASYETRMTETPTVAEIRAAAMPLPVAVPPDARGVAELVGRFLDPELTTQGLTGILVFAMRPGVLERWEVGGELPCALVDLVRSIAAQGPTEAVVVVQPCVVEVDGVKRRGFAMVAQRDGRSATRVLAVSQEGGRSVAIGHHVREDGEVPEPDRWIGLPPSVDIALQAVGFEEGGGPVAEG